MSCRQAADQGSWPAANAGAPATCESVHLSMFATAQAAALALPVASSELQLRRRKNAAGHNADSTVLRGRGQARWEGMCLGAACIRARWWGKGQVLWEGLKGVSACRSMRVQTCAWEGVWVYVCMPANSTHPCMGGAATAGLHRRASRGGVQKQARKLSRTAAVVPRR